jgi:LL-diaminopimelate aminotransferase
MKLNPYFADLDESYFFSEMRARTDAYAAMHPDEHLYRMGIGDVTQPLCPAVIQGLMRGVRDQSTMETFHGYLFECGTDFLRSAIAEHYATRGVTLFPEEIFITSGAGDEIGALGDLFSSDNTVLVTEPAYPAYVDTSIMGGRRIVHLPSGKADGFLPMPVPDLKADLIFLCSPNNPTGAAYTKAQLKEWVDYANTQEAVILFDAAYEAFITDSDVPHSIFEIDGAERCAIEICSLSKTAGFTGTRCGYTIVPNALIRNGQSLRALWVRSRTTKTNGISYILQRGAEAVFTPAGQAQTKASIAVYQENARIWMDALDRAGLWYTGGRNAPYIWVACPNGRSSWAMFDLLLTKAQIIVTPGVGFGACGEGFFRISVFSEPSEASAAAERFLSLMQTL